MKVERLLTLFLAVVALGLLQGSAFAAITPLDSSSFAHKYEADALPATPEYSGWGNGTASASGGMLTYATTSTGSEREWAATPWDGDVNQAKGFTIEWRVKITAPTADSPYGAFRLVASTGTGPAAFIYIGPKFVQVQTYNNDWTNLSTADNTDAYHTFRITRDADGSNYQMWRDGVSLGTFSGHSGYTQKMMYWGDGTSPVWGTASIDYLRWTAGPFSPPGAVEAAPSKTTHNYEGDAIPGGTEYTGWTGGGGTASVSNGQLSYSTTTGKLVEYSATPWATEVSQSTGFTVEWHMKVTAPTAYMPFGAFRLVAGDGEGPTAFICIGTNFVTTQREASNWTNLSNADNTDAFHVFKLVKKPGSKTFNLWRDGVDLGTIDGNYQYKLKNLYWGDGTAGVWGTATIDYVRWFAGS